MHLSIISVSVPICTSPADFEHTFLIWENLVSFYCWNPSCHAFFFNPCLHHQQGNFLKEFDTGLKLINLQSIEIAICSRWHVYSLMVLKASNSVKTQFTFPYLNSFLIRCVNYRSYLLSCLFISIHYVTRLLNASASVNYPKQISVTGPKQRKEGRNLIKRL